MRGMFCAGHVLMAFFVSFPSCGRTPAEKAVPPAAPAAPLPAGLTVGQPAPDLEGQDLGGMPLKLADYRGKIVIVCFSGHW